MSVVTSWRVTSRFFGPRSGQLIATEVVDVRPSAAVTGQVMAPRFILDEAAFFPRTR